MPGKRDVIIDSKVSLSAWDEYTNATEENTKNLALRKHIDSVKKFIKDLNTDSYANLYDIETVDSILMSSRLSAFNNLLANTAPVNG